MSRISRTFTRSLILLACLSLLAACVPVPRPVQFDHRHRLAVGQRDESNDQADDDRARPGKLHHHLQRRWDADWQSGL